MAVVNTPENRKRAADMERKLAEHDEAESVEKAEVARRYNPREACRRSSEILAVTDETLGIVRFGVLSISEFTDLKLCETKDENKRIRYVRCRKVECHGAWLHVFMVGGESNRSATFREGKRYPPVVVLPLLQRASRN